MFIVVASKMGIRLISASSQEKVLLLSGLTIMTFFFFFEKGVAGSRLELAGRHVEKGLEKV